ncbi:3-hydroxyacyl-CoA dehydrogenase NAD-binding domain-containing protein [Flagellatimonas centrodinii]|uniref:3-hydroxyacyl-CoA dehydrogenase NAD-binding domain-containing protein n=1 Tax=Flagellatimonas centrodinii TaxID=2806210 RepID=UPI001FED5495|nr:3-hydroxyacyl-CoA dehydrogenase NAD-binding domain-containing protein [Flagellatimonas centrodinii]ULQ45615.1 3-hydroxyacyl-CoA dehydrogenase NAD-binding domain-containing protein [Flagellatimonas centrodinii]
MTAVKFEKDAQGVVTLTLDMPGRSMNVLNEALTGPFLDAIGQIERDPSITGVILTSGKKEFLAGADIEGLFKITDPQDAFELAEQFKALLRRLEKCGRPVVAALNGTALGGGLELALACHYRIALNNPKAKFGLPEVKLGVLPGGGGTQRLPRLIGIQPALPLMLEGKELRAEAAVKQGIIHELAETPEEMITKAKAWIAANPKAVQPWDDKKFRWPGGDSKSPANAQVWAIAPSMASAKSYGNYPAVTNIMSCVFEGGITDFDTGCRVESRYFAELVVGQVSKNMIGTLWFQLNGINKGSSRPEGIERSTVKKLGILGAGMMGAGIAYVSAKVGIEVVLLDTTQEAADKGKAYSENLLDKAMKKGRESAEGKAALLARITPTTAYELLKGCDLIIEAVFEDRGIKADVTRKAEAMLGKDAVFASNTSTLPITGLAEASERPKNFIGLHFFSPVDKMPLVEIIKGKKTSKETLARGFDYVQQIKKTPIVVNDSRGFYTSRCFATYPMEGLTLLAEGQHPRSIEVAGLQAGMPVGPLAVQDEVSMSLSMHILEQTRKDLAAAGKPVVEHPGVAVIEKMVKQLDRPGKKAGKGLYDYPAGGQKHLWAGLAEHFPLADTQLPQQELIDRMMFAQANEAAKCHAEGVVETVADTNIGSIFGWGFAPFQGGALQFINAYGVENFVKRSRELARKYGDRFKPAPILVKMAKEGRRFE